MITEYELQEACYPRGWRFHEENNCFKMYNTDASVFIILTNEGSNGWSVKVEVPKDLGSNILIETPQYFNEKNVLKYIDKLMLKYINYGSNIMGMG